MSLPSDGECPAACLKKHKLQGSFDYAGGSHARTSRSAQDDDSIC
jgi:hypothetical protein